MNPSTNLPPALPAGHPATTPLLLRQNCCAAESGSGVISVPAFHGGEPAQPAAPARQRTLAAMLHAAFEPAAPGQAVREATTVPRQARRKLWELPTRWHCALVGTCLDVAELRRLALKAGFDVEHMSDYSLHSACIGHCDTRNPLTEAVQRLLDKRHAARLAQLAQVRDSTTVLARWQAACAEGTDIPGALWAAWTHGALAESDGQVVFGDIHMLSHQNGAALRADLQHLQRLQQENARLTAELEALRAAHARQQLERERSVAELRKRYLDAEQRAALLGHRELELAEARQALRAHTPLAERAAALAARVETLEERNAANARRANTLAAELNEAQDSLAAAEAALAAALGVCDGVSGAGSCGRTCPAEARLTGQCVLCIGGRTGLVDGYRRLVETRGGRFLHHDGGQEESLHRIDAAIANADAVVCQAGCVSHAAYWRLKEACKKLGKPCVFVKSPGVGSFARGLDALAAPTETSIRRLS